MLTWRTDALGESGVERFSEEWIGETAEEQFDQTSKNVYISRLYFVGNDLTQIWTEYVYKSLTFYYGCGN